MVLNSQISGFGQPQALAQEHGLAIFELYTTSRVDQIIELYFPSEKAWVQIMSTLGLNPSLYEKSKIAIHEGLRRDFRAMLNHHVQNDSLVQDSTLYLIPKSEEFKDDPNINLFGLRVYCHDPIRSYQCDIRLFEFYNEVFLSPVSGLNFGIIR